MNKNIKKRRRAQKENERSIEHLARCSAISVGISLSSALALAFIFTIIVFGTKDPTGAIIPLSIIIICLSALEAGFISFKLYKNAPWSTGLLSGAMMTAFILIVALFLKSNSPSNVSPSARALLHILPIPLSSLGAFFGSLRLPQKRRTTLRRR